MENTIIENVTLNEIINGLNTGLYKYNDIDNIRIINIEKPNYQIIPVEADISDSIIKFIESDKLNKKFNPEDIIADTTVLDFIIILTDLVSEPGKYKILNMSVLELFIANSQLENENSLFDLKSEKFKCYEINYIEEKTELPTDMHILG